MIVRVDETRHDQPIARVDDLVHTIGWQTGVDSDDVTAFDQDVGASRFMHIGVVIVDLAASNQEPLRISHAKCLCCQWYCFGDSIFDNVPVEREWETGRAISPARTL